MTWWTPNDVITTDKYLSAFPNNYWKTDIFYAGGRQIQWRGRTLMLPAAQTNVILAGHSDYPVTEQVRALRPRAKWFAVNTQTPNVIGLPLGITNHTSESSLHSIYGNVDIMYKVAQTSRMLKNMVYMNFAVDTYPKERLRVWEMFSGKSWVTTEYPTNTLFGRELFLQQIRNHSFVLCPRGNGIDTHRLWETLYMGSIPIVIDDIAHAEWKDLPICFVTRWEDVTPDFLERERKRIEEGEWNIAKLRIGFWIDFIRSKTI